MQFDNFYQNRCLTAAEAAWVACELPFNYFNPTVLILQLHLPGEQPIYFDENDPEEHILEKTLRKTQLEQYFARPMEDLFDNITFEAFFQQYKPKSDGSVTKRETPIVAVVRNVDYSDPEHFALYMLLKTVSARSFDALKQHHLSFEEAAIAAGVFAASSDSVHSTALYEMSLRHTSTQQMISYLTIIAQTDPRHFEKVFFDTWDAVAEHDHTLQHVEDVLQLIVESLKKNGFLLEELIQPSDALIQVLQRLRPLRLNSFFEYNIVESPLDQTQEATIQVILHNPGTNFYINGCAGSGKTFTLTQLIQRLQSSRRVLTAAYTGIAASLLPNGMTTHKLFGLPLEDDNESDITSITPQSLSGQILQRADVIIIDEISMLHEKHLSRIDNVLRNLRTSSSPFGGVQMILSGDFNQLPPVVKCPPECLHTATTNASIRTSVLFTLFTSLSLNKAHRFLSEDWASFLLSVAQGQGDPIYDGPFGSSELKLPLSTSPTCLRPGQIQSTVNELFPEPTPLQLIAPYHDTVDSYNASQLRTYFSNDQIIQLSAHYTFPPNMRFTAEDIRHTVRRNIPNDKLFLAVGAPVFIMRNLDIANGLANGTTAFVSSIETNTVEVKLIDRGTSHSIPRISFNIGKEQAHSLRHQFPLALAFAATISKVQGKTSTVMIIDLRNPCFCHGQLYVALSRVRDYQKLFLLLDENSPIQNIVYQQLSFR